MDNNGVNPAMTSGFAGNGTGMNSAVSLGGSVMTPPSLLSGATSRYSGGGGGIASIISPYFVFNSPSRVSVVSVPFESLISYGLQSETVHQLIDMKAYLLQQVMFMC